jgi:hypothetical protein
MIWKNAVVAYFKLPSQHLPCGVEEDHEKYVRIIDVLSGV